MFGAFVDSSPSKVGLFATSGLTFLSFGSFFLSRVFSLWLDVLPSASFCFFTLCGVVACITSFVGAALPCFDSFESLSPGDAGLVGFITGCDKEANVFLCSLEAFSFSLLTDLCSYSLVGEFSLYMLY